MITRFLFGARLAAAVFRAGRPRPRTLADRLGDIPQRAACIDHSVRIGWDAHHVPQIVAESERDLAFGVGVVHAHLRLAQIEAMRRLALGRVAEVAGPVAIGIDRAMRLMRLDQAVPAIEAALPPRTRTWAEAFVAGLNHVLLQAPRLPYEFNLLDIPREPWTLAHLLTVSRLASADFSWIVLARLLRARRRLPEAAWTALWPLLQEGDRVPAADPPDAAFGAVRGSNSAAVSAARTASGFGLIASDPHLSLASPPLWLIAGLHAPGLDVVGLMIPGLPVVALGRNAHIAWGGTNLHAATSDLVDVSGEPLATRQETIRVRGRGKVSVPVRESRFGPVVSDGLLFPSSRPLALRWVGHRSSDEMTAMLNVMHAQSADAFREALQGFAVPGQTMVVVERQGKAARVIAAHLPRRAIGPMPTLAVPPDSLWPLDDLVVAADWPTPEEAVVASANDRPAPGPLLTPVPVGFFFSAPARAQRLRALLQGQVTAERMRAVALDTRQAEALRVRDVLLGRLPPGSAREALAAWDGDYTVSSEGALLFEALCGALARRLIPRDELALLAGFWSGPALIASRCARASPKTVAAALRDAERLRRRWRTWGAVHRIRLQHPLGMLPAVGHWFRSAPFAAPGSNDTLNKTGHGTVRGRHTVRFGACARHVSDMADPAANWFTLLGGQDGWLGSTTSSDQVLLWRRGEGVRVPLHPGPPLLETVLRPP